MQDDMSTEETGKLPLRYKALMAAVAVATLVTVWLIPDDEQATPPPLPDLPATHKANAPAQQGGDVIRDGDRARSFMADLRNNNQDPDPDVVFAEARRLQTEGYAVDAHVLYRYAARRGHGKAAMLLGTQADPEFYIPDSPDSLNDQPEQAYRWYSIAAAQGIDEADERLQALHKRMQKSAADGDERAQRVLLLWK
jgi:hypothetical protein